MDKTNTKRKITARSSTRTPKSKAKTRPRARAVSRPKSMKAQRQRRNPDGTFAKGYKKGKKNSVARIKQAAPVKGNASTINKPKKKPSRRVNPNLKRLEKRREATSLFDFECSVEIIDNVLDAVLCNFSEDERGRMSRHGKIVVKENNNLANGHNKGG